MRKFKEKMTAFFRELYVDEQKVLVFGEGDVHARLMLVGEAPGEQEVLQGHPFVGKAGKNLDEFLRLTGAERSQMYITNVVKFRPVKRSAAGNSVNRAPTAEEIKLSLPWLVKEIDLVSPRLIVTLGNVPLKALLGHAVSIGQLHGRLIEEGVRPIYPLYHPASLIYNPSLRGVYAEDVLRLKQIMSDMDL